MATNKQVYEFNLNMGWLESGSEDWQIWYQRTVLLDYSKHLFYGSEFWRRLDNRFTIRSRTTMAFLSIVRAKAEYLKTHSLENEEYPGEYEFHLEFLDSGIKFMQPSAYLEN